MTAHELARLLLAGPDVEVVGVSDHPASEGCEYKVKVVETRRLHWVAVKTGYSAGTSYGLSGDTSVVSQGAFDRRPLEGEPPVDILVLVAGGWLEDPGPTTKECTDQTR